jgi:peptidoglycan/xylan/chitin deacetylase (PgdA/CDA1 family)
MPSRPELLHFSNPRLSAVEAELVRMKGELTRSQTRLLNWLASLLSALPGRRGLLILTFHRVLPAPDPLLDDPCAATFAALVDMLVGVFHPMTVREAAAQLQRGRLPPRAICITFDDGYADNIEVAVPILRARGAGATFFVSTGFIGGGCMWNDVVIESVRQAQTALDLQDLGLGQHELRSATSRRQAVSQILEGLKYLDPEQRLHHSRVIAERAGAKIPADLMMSKAQLRALASQGMEVGAHCVSHPILSRIGTEQARQEIRESKRLLEQTLGERVSSFAYPNGRPGLDYERRHVDMVRDAGFEVAVTTAWGCARRGCDPYQLPRVAPWDRTITRYAARLVKCYLQRPPRVVA